MKTKTIKQTVKIHATPKQVYEALMDSKKHAKFTGQKAKITNKVGGDFSCYDSYITGINLALKPAELIVQAWRTMDWPQGHFSTVSFKLSKTGKQTKLEFEHIGVPTGDIKAKTEGWKSHYWTPLKAMLEGAK